MSGLVGREQPAAVLTGEVERTLTSHGGLVLVAGEAGIGKSALVAGAVAAAREAGALVAVGACWDREGAPGHWPWVQVVRSLARSVAPDEWEAARAEAGGELAVLLGEGATSGSADDEFALHDAVTLLLVALARARPVVVVLEDLHWADEASLRLLEFAARHGWYERLLLVGTYRDVEVEAGDHPLAAAVAPLVARATTITLTGLDRDQVGALVAVTTGRSPDPAVVDDLHRRTGGNPFFVEQTARLWVSRGVVDEVPPGVRDTVERRLALLPEADRAALTTVAALGHEVAGPVLAAALDLETDPVVGGLAEPVAAGLVVPGDDGGVRFVHDLVRQTLVAGLAPDDARRLHARLLSVLDRTDLADHVRPGDLAHHAHRAGSEVDVERRVALQRAASRDAADRLAMDEAAGHLRRALDGIAADEVRPRAFATVELGWIVMRTGDIDGARRLFEEATRAALELGDPSLLTRAALSVRAAVWLVAGDDARVRAEEVVDEAHRRLVVEGGHPTTATTAWEREQELTAVAVTMCRSSGDDRALWDALTVRHDAIWTPGRATERLAVVDEMVEVARRNGAAGYEVEARGLRVLDLIEMADPRLGEAHASFLARAGQVDSAWARALAGWVDAVLADLEGRFDDARGRLDEVMAAERRGGDPAGDVASLQVQARWAIELQQGRDDAVDALLDEAASLHPHADLLRAVTAAERGQVERAAAVVAALRGSSDEPDRWFAPLWLRAQALVAGATADRALADDLAASLRPTLAGLTGQVAVMAQGPVDGPFDLWAGLVEVGQGRVDEAVARFEAAATTCARIGARAWSVRARAERELVAPTDAGPSVVEEARALGMARLVERLSARPARIPPAATADAGPASPTDPTGPTGPNGPTFRREGAVWELTWDGATAHVPDAKGVRDIHVLLGRPGMGVRAVDLLDPEAGATGRAARSMGGDDVLDERAKTAYRSRLTQLDEEIDRALERGADRRAAELDAERAALIDELRRATGLGGRSRRLGDDAERARKAVRERIRDTIKRLDAGHPALATHLRDSVKTGATCSYEPSDPVAWSL